MNGEAVNRIIETRVEAERKRKDPMSSEELADFEQTSSVIRSGIDTVLNARPFIRNHWANKYLVRYHKALPMGKFEAEPGNPDSKRDVFVVPRSSHSPSAVDGWSKNWFEFELAVYMSRPGIEPKLEEGIFPNNLDSIGSLEVKGYHLADPDRYNKDKLEKFKPLLDEVLERIDTLSSVS